MSGPHVGTVGQNTTVIVTLHQSVGHDLFTACPLAAKDEVPSLREYFPSVTNLRAELVKNGVLVPEGENFRFTQAYTFNSPSMASAVVLGRSSNGRMDWKDASGKTLKELQEQVAQS